MDPNIEPQTFVSWFRNSSPYINAFRHRTFVIAFGGEMIAEEQFAQLVHDIALLHSLGVRLVLVHGARPQIVHLLEERQAGLQYVNGLRITDTQAMQCVKEAAGSVRVEIEALLSMGLSNSPMAGAAIRVVTGNFVTAQPLGIRDGVDYQHTGEVRRIDSEAIESQLQNNNIVLLSPLGYSPTGEVFNLSAEDVATATAVALQAEKLIYLIDGPGILDEEEQLIRELYPSEAQQLLEEDSALPGNLARTLFSSIFACTNGVVRTHLIDRHIDGSLLLELFTRDGIGTLVTESDFEGLRTASIDDVGGILELIEPLEQDGQLVRRSRELMEIEIEHFVVLERDGTIIGCAALYPYAQDKMGELACMAVHPDYRNEGRGEELLEYLEEQAAKLGIERLFVLTTRTAHWFLERGFSAATLAELPMKKQELYNYQRRSKVFFKTLA